MILDLGAGSSYNVLDFFLVADDGIILVKPDALSILDGYNFLKKAFFRKAREVHPDINKVMPKSGEAFQEVHQSYTYLLARV